MKSVEKIFISPVKSMGLSQPGQVRVDFSGIVTPGSRVEITARKVFFRRRKLRSEVDMKLEDGTVVCSGFLSGMGVPK